jgi:hypothetical protein
VAVISVHFPPISQVEQWPQAKRAAIYRVNC